MTCSEIWTQRSARVCLPLFLLAIGSFTTACSDDGGTDGENGGSSNGDGGNGAGSGGSAGKPPLQGGAGSLPDAGGPGDGGELPSEAQEEDTSSPTSVVGNGTPESCTSDEVVAAVLKGGVITFSCGAEPVVIKLNDTVKIHNLNTEKVVIDGGGLVTLDGQGVRQIIYQNACDGELGIDNERCDLQDYPKTTLQNLKFVNGFDDSKEGGGAVFVRGGQFKIVGCGFFGNLSTYQGPDTGGGAVRIQGVQTKPVYIAGSTFGGDGALGNVASNGGALSGLHSDFIIYNSVFDNNEADGCCGNPATTPPGGGSGGAIYMDGVELILSIYGSSLSNNRVNSHGSAIFFVSNDHKGELTVADSAFENNAEGEGNWYPEPDISMHSDTSRTITDTTFD